MNSSFPAAMLLRMLQATFIASCLVADAHAQECTCNGTMLDHYKGGDGRPLLWTFETYVINQRAADPPLICYLKSVTNESQTEVRRIFWEVAGFFRRYAQANTHIPSCARRADGMKPNPRNGPLYHGIIGGQYDTTVREPTNGWKEGQATRVHWNAIPANWKVAQAASPPAERLPPVVSSFVLDLEDSGRAAVNVISDGFRERSGTTTLTYNFFNSGTAAVRVLVNLPNDGPLARSVPMISNPFLLQPTRIMEFKYSTEKPVILQSAAVIFYDQPGREVIGVDSAGFYGPAEGKREVDVELLWRSLRSAN
jgi:hypothetical protein